MGFKTAISFGRNIQFASNFVYTLMDPVSIDLSCSLIFTCSVTEILLCKVIAHFSLSRRHFSITTWFPLLRAHEFNNSRAHSAESINFASYKRLGGSSTYSELDLLMLRFSFHRHTQHGTFYQYPRTRHRMPVGSIDLVYKLLSPFVVI